MIESLGFLLHFPMKVQRIIGIQLSSIFIIIRNSGNTNRQCLLRNRYLRLNLFCVFQITFLRHLCITRMSSRRYVFIVRILV